MSDVDPSWLRSCHDINPNRWVPWHAAFIGNSTDINEATIVRVPFNATSGTFLGDNAQYIDAGGNYFTNGIHPASDLVDLTAMAVDRGGTVATFISKGGNTTETQLYEASLTGPTPNVNYVAIGSEGNPNAYSNTFCIDPVLLAPQVRSKPS